MGDQKHRGIIVMAGEPGAGKTTLSRSLVKSWPNLYATTSSGDVLRCLPGVPSWTDEGLDPREDQLRSAIKRSIEHRPIVYHILDGFPRSEAQLLWLMEFVELWMVVVLTNKHAQANRAQRGKALPVRALAAQLSSMTGMLDAVVLGRHVPLRGMVRYDYNNAPEEPATSVLNHIIRGRIGSQIVWRQEEANG